VRKQQGMRRGGDSVTETRAGTGAAPPVGARPGARTGDDVQQAGGELSEALEELRVATEDLQEHEALLGQAGAEVAAQMQRYRTLFDFAPDGYLVTGETGVIEEANLAITRMLRSRHRDLIGKPLVVYFVPADRRRLMRLLRAAVAEPVPHEESLELQPRSGAPIPVSCRVGAEPDEGRIQIRWLLHDVTRRRDDERRLEEALHREQEAAARLRDLDAIKNAFLLAVSHDLRGPVTAIVALARMLAEDAAMPEERRSRTASSIAANAALVERVQRNLIDLDRLARHAVVLEAGEVDVAALVAARVAAADTLDRPVSAHVETAHAMLDAAVVERILDNLLSNAAHHTPARTPVEVSARSEPGGVVVSVADHGQGVPEMLRRAIFEPFGVAIPGGGGAPSAGVGIGLHLVARFAAMHGGRAWVEDTPGGGATFRVLLRELS